jgi:hypothetical protein
MNNSIFIAANFSASSALQLVSKGNAGSFVIFRDESDRLNIAVKHEGQPEVHPIIEVYFLSFVTNDA